jgi:anti-sigma B factor antagonist
MHVDVRKVEDVVVIDFEGRMVAGEGDELLVSVVKELLDEGYRNLLVNLSQVEYIDSMGLGELVQSYKMSQRAGAHLKLLRPQERIRKSLHLTKLLPLFEIFDKEDEAVASYGNPSSEAQEA